MNMDMNQIARMLRSLAAMFCVVYGTLFVTQTLIQVLDHTMAMADGIISIVFALAIMIGTVALVIKQTKEGLDQ